MGTMKAVFYAGKDKVEVRQTECPVPGPGEALIRVSYAGICGTDLSIVAGKHPRANPPLIMGHEFSGRIESLGSSPGNLVRGDKVVAEPLISCGTCFSCRSGYAYVCEKLGLYGIDAPGAFAEYIKIPVDKVFKYPDRVDDRTAALIEPVAVAVHAVRLSRIKVGDTVCVLGAGPIGLLTALVARQAGAAQVLICEKEPLRVEIAKGFGLTAVDVNSEDPVEVVNDATQGRGADIVFEVAGAPATIMLTTKLCRVRGEIVQVACPKEPRALDIVDLSFKELVITGIRVYAPYDFERAIRIVADSGIDFSPLLSSPFELDGAAQAFEQAARGSDAMRVLFQARDV